MKHRGWLGALLLFGCSGDTFGSNPVNPIKTGSVAVVRMGLWPYAVQQHDTLTVDAHARDADGYPTAFNTTIRWQWSDSSLVSEATSFDKGRALRLRGTAPGLLRLTASIDGVTAQDTLRILPPLAPARLVPATLTLAAGDTATIRLVLTDIHGQAVAPRYVHWTTDTSRLMRVHGYGDSLSVEAPDTVQPGTTWIRATVFHLSVLLPITIRLPDA